MQRIDVYRETTTTLPFADEAKIEDFWNGTDTDNRPLSDLWTGKVLFYLIPVQKGKDIRIGERVVKARKTNRPPHIWPEIWNSSTHQEQAQLKAKEEQAKHHRSIRGVSSPIVLQDIPNSSYRFPQPGFAEQSKDSHNAALASEDEECDKYPDDLSQADTDIPSDDSNSSSRSSDSSAASPSKRARGWLPKRSYQSSTRARFLRRETKARRKLHHRSLIAPMLARSRNQVFTDHEDDDFKAYLACALPSGEACHHKPKHPSKPMRTFSRQDQWREALVFQQLPTKLIPTIRDAADAMEKEWTKLERKQVWILESVQDQDEVSRQAKKT